MGSNPAGDQIFFENQYFLHAHFLKSGFDSWHSKHALKRDLSKINTLHLGT